MKKKVILILIMLNILTSCETYKVYTKLVETENKKTYLKPLIVIPTNSITKKCSELIKAKLNDALLNKNLNATIHLLEIKQDELKLNAKETTLIDEISPIYEKNNNDVIILLKYEEFNYGAYGSFTQRVIMFEKDTEKIIWTAVGYATSDGSINKYCIEIVDKLLLDKVIAY
jgi:hypothetical protein